MLYLHTHIWSLCSPVPPYMVAMFTSTPIYGRYVHQYTHIWSLCSPVHPYMVAMFTSTPIYGRYVHQYTHIWSLCSCMYSLSLPSGLLFILTPLLPRPLSFSCPLDDFEHSLIAQLKEDLSYVCVCVCLCVCGRVTFCSYVTSLLLTSSLSSPHLLHAHYRIKTVQVWK